VLAHVGQGFPDDPVHGPPDHRRGEGGIAVLDQLGRRADLDRLRDQRGEPGRGRHLGAIRRGAQDPDQVTQLV
jgi:hypothetical protein